VGSAPLSDAELPARRSTGSQAALYIRKLIFDGHLRAGDRVHQDDIATALGISRIPVREALVALEQQGWVKIEPNRGAFVAALDERAVRDHYELAGLVFALAARKAIARADDELADRLTELADAFARADSASTAEAVMRAFHAAIVDAAASPRVVVVLRALSTLVPGQFYEVLPKVRALQEPGFAAIALAVKSRDADRATAEYVASMRNVADEVVRVFGARGILTQTPRVD
jgi:DNA-binding GntR family transcriptional regulator